MLLVDAFAKKISVSISAPLVDDLQYLSARLGVSRSALITELLGEALPALASVLRMVPEGASPEEAKRLRGASVGVIRARLAEAQRAADEFEAEGQREPGCTCTITAHERMENKSCPVHFPRKGRRGRA